LGGRASWGVRTAATGSTVNPGLLVEQLFPYVLTLLNETLLSTPVERLAHVTLTAADSQPPSIGVRGEGESFMERNRLGIRWQLGF
jgi:hypothetical protein